MKNTMCAESALHSRGRMLKYKALAVAFSYPDARFFEMFPDARSLEEELVVEYDQLFRTGKVWLYGAEHEAKNEFQRSNIFADIMGFYKAFSVEPDLDRPDSLPVELEFMHFLIFKRVRALDNPADLEDAKTKADTCLDAEEKFFAEHLYPAASRIAAAVNEQSTCRFYKEISEDMTRFLESEKEILGVAS